jgi:hypothetical protein
MRRRSRGIGIATVLLALGWTLFTQLAAWSKRGELRLAQQEIARGQLGAAHRRLAALAARPGVWKARPITGWGFARRSAAAPTLRCGYSPGCRKGIYLTR